MSERCDNCNKPATINVQKMWIKWNYNYKTDNYSKKWEPIFCVEEPVGNDNLHLCKKCYELWYKGEIKVFRDLI